MNQVGSTEESMETGDERPAEQMHAYSDVDNEWEDDSKGESTESTEDKPTPRLKASSLGYTKMPGATFALPSWLGPKVITRDDLETSSDQHLCAACRAIDFVTAFFRFDQADQATIAHSLTGPVVADLDVPSRDMITAACPLCRILGKMIFECRSKHSRADSDSLPQLWHIRTLPDISFTSIGIEEDESWPEFARMIIAVCNYPFIERGTILATSTIARGTLHPLPTLCTSTNQDSCRLSIPGEKVSPSLLRSILNQCLLSHDTCSERRFKFPRNANVIDCHNHNIVRLQPSFEYLTLSYVWGPNPSGITAASNSLPSLLPRTIKDAIDICLDLGYRYLWIDRYCIDQSDLTSKKEQIAQMGNIYACGVASICALGPNDNYGISGVSLPRTCDFFHAQGLHIVHTRSAPKYKIAHSQWITRGWTLQEAALSPRLLLFTSEGVIMACQRGIYDESITDEVFWPQIEGSVTARGNLLFGDRYRDGIGGETEYDKYHLYRQAFLVRNLSHESDTFDAFRAILSSLETPSYWGVAAFTTAKSFHYESQTPQISLHRAFIKGLCWSCKEPTGRRRCHGQIPSWSWLSQTTAISGREEIYSFVHDRFLARIRVMTPSLDSLDLEDLFNDHGATSLIPAQSLFLEVRSLMAHWTLRERHISGEYNVDITVEVPVTPSPVSSSVGQVRLRGQISVDALSGQETQPPSAGLALLLEVEQSVQGCDASGTASKPSWRWLAVSQCPDASSFEREGLIFVSAPVPSLMQDEQGELAIPDTLQCDVRLC